MPSVQALGRGYVGPAPRVRQYVMGVDLAAQHDYTAVCVVELSNLPRLSQERNPKREPRHAVVHLERWRGLSYPRTVDRILARFQGIDVSLSERREVTELEPVMVVDATGVGLPVLDMIRERYRAAVGVLITGGDTESRGDGNVHRVPKRSLVSHLQVALESGRLKVARELPLAGTLATEMRGFRVRLTQTGREAYGNDVTESLWREADHDDLVLSVALAVWHGESQPRPRSLPFLREMRRKLSPW
jgi:hypothetical protein